MADEMRMHGQQIQAALFIRDVELRLKHLVHLAHRRHRAVRVAAEVRRIVEDAFDRQLDDAGRLAVEQ